MFCFNFRAWLRKISGRVFRHPICRDSGNPWQYQNYKPLLEMLEIRLVPVQGSSLSISSLNPPAATQGNSDTLLTVTGTSFASGATVDWNGTVLTTTYTSSTQVQATIPAADLTGTGTFTITVVNPDASTSNGQTFTVNAPPAITTTSLPAGTAGQSYNQTLSTTGGTGPLNFTVSSGSLPAGLGLNSSSGAITGTPAAGTYNFTVTATDSSRVGGTTGLVDLWSGQNNGNDSVDSKPATLVNGVTFATGEVGNAFQLNGSNQYVQLPSNVFPFPASGTGNTPFSFQTWFKTSSGGVILGQQTSVPFNGPNGWVASLYVDTSGYLRAQMFWTGSVNQVVSTQKVNDGSFHMVSVSYNGTTETVYLDGTSIGSLGTTSSPFTQQSYSPTYYYQLGTGETSGWPAGNGGYYSFNGLIDEAALYNRALSASEVSANYNAGKAGSAAIVGSAASASQSYSLTINPLSSSASSTALTSTGPSSSYVYGQSTTLTATVSTTASPNIVGGLEGFYYNLSVYPANGLPDVFNFPGNTPNANATLVKSRTDAQVYVPDNNGFVPPNPVSGLGTNDVAVDWSGLININTAGSYTFYTPSDDATRLYVDGVPVVSNDAQHGLTDGIVTPISLSAGMHTYQLLYEQGNGGAGVEADYQGPDTGNARVLIPASAFFHGPSGTATFFDNGSPIGTGWVTTTPGDVASASFPATLPVGTNVITTTYNGDSDFGSSTAPTSITETVTAATTTAAVGSNLSPSVYGQAVTLTAAVTDASTLSAGVIGSYFNLSAGPSSVNVPFNLPSGTPNTYATLVASRTDAQINVPDNGGGFVPSPSVSGLGTSNVAAEWTGLIQIATPGTYTFFSKSDDGTIMYIDGAQAVSNDGQHGFIDGNSSPMVLSAGYHTIVELFEQGGGGAGVEADYQGPDTGNSRKVIPASVLFHSGGSPTGTVTFFNGGTSIGTGTLSTTLGLTTASLTTATLPAGSNSITVSYAGDNNAGSSTSAVQTQVVNANIPAISVSPSASTSVSGQPLMFTATTTGYVPGLTASYYNSSLSLGTSGTTLSSVFNLPSGSPTATTTLVATRTDPQVDVNNSYLGFVPTQPVSGLATTNSAASWSGMIQISQAGNYTFYSSSDDGSRLYIDGNLAVNNDVLRAYGDGTSTTVSLTPGLHTFLELFFQGGSYAGVEASYQGPDTGGLRELIPASVFFHSGTPTGTVTFYDGATSIGTGTLAVGGGGDQATFSTTALTPGSHAITAAYTSGDSSFNPSAPSAAASVTVSLAGLVGNNLTLSSPSSGSTFQIDAPGTSSPGVYVANGGGSVQSLGNLSPSAPVLIQTTGSNNTLNIVGAASDSISITNTGATIDGRAVSFSGISYVDVTGNATLGSAGSPLTGFTTLTVTGTATIDANVTTTGAQDFGGAVALNADATLNAGSSNVTFNGAVTGSQVLTIDTTGDIEFLAPVVSVDKLITGSTGKTYIGANLSATGDLSFYNPVVLTADTTLTDTGTGIYFYSSVDSDRTATPRNLTVDTTATAYFGGAVGGIAPLASLTVTAATTQLNGGSVITTSSYGSMGIQDYEDATTVSPLATTSSTAETLTGATITFASTLDDGAEAAGTDSLTVNGNVVFDGPVDSIAALASIQVSGSITDVVSNTNDSGAGSLRQAILNADVPIQNGDGGPATSTITFDIPTTDPGFSSASGSWTITPATVLPTITNPVVIDGYTEAGAAPNSNGPWQSDHAVLNIVLDGASAGSSAIGLTVSSNNTTVEGLVVNNFAGGGIWLQGNDDAVQGDFLGTDATGTMAEGNPSADVALTGTGDLVGGTQPADRNIISGNGNGGQIDVFAAYGYLPYGNAGVYDNGYAAEIEGNFIGTDATGTKALPNYFGIESIGSDTKLTVGGMAVGAGNLISGNGDAGIWAGASAGIQGNRIGTDVTGMVALPNSTGIWVTGNGSSIGGTAPAASNLISGNSYAGINLQNSSNSIIEGNQILGNAYYGVDVFGAANNNQIGDLASGAANVIADNGTGAFLWVGGSGNNVAGNDFTCDGAGIVLYEGELNTNISGNTITLNTGPGVEISGAGSTKNVVTGNFIGTDANSDTGLGNTGDGILITNSASGNTIGGTTAGTGNVISGNSGYAIDVTGTGSTGNVIENNMATGTESVAIGGSDTVYLGPETSSSFTVTAGTIYLSSNLDAVSGDMTLNGTTVLNADVTATAGTTTFDGPVTGNGNSLGITGNAVFDGEATGLSTLSVTGTTNINTDAITTSGAQSYDGAVTLGSSTGVTVLDSGSGSFTFGSDIDGTGTQTLEIVEPVQQFTVTGTIQENVSVTAPSFSNVTIGTLAGSLLAPETTISGSGTITDATIGTVTSTGIVSTGAISGMSVTTNSGTITAAGQGTTSNVSIGSNSGSFTAPEDSNTGSGTMSNTTIGTNTGTVSTGSISGMSVSTNSG